MSITPVYLSIKTLDFPCYAGLPTQELKRGRIRLRQWDNLHFRATAQHPMSLILVERLEAETDQLKTQPLWLVWVGCQMPPLNEIWQQYLRRESA